MTGKATSENSNSSFSGKIEEFLLHDFIRESNAIEEIFSQPDAALTRIYRKLLRAPAPSVDELAAFVLEITHGFGHLRSRVGMDVVVGNHVPPRGGEGVPRLLSALLVAMPGMDPVEFHRRYEALHPFLDGNGRSGRALWLWQMLRGGYRLQYKFLRMWYYQSLSNDRKSAE